MIVTQKEIRTKLTKGLLDLIILQLLDNHPMHGYELMVTIRKDFGVSFSASTIYPILGRLEKEKYVSCEWNLKGDRARKVFRLTADGESMLGVTTLSLRVICKSMSTINLETHKDLQLKGCHCP